MYRCFWEEMLGPVPINLNTLIGLGVWILENKVQEANTWRLQDGVGMPWALLVKVLGTQSCPTLWDPMDCSPPGFSVHGILQARILEWVAIPFSRGSSWPRDWTRVSQIAGRFFPVYLTTKCKRHFLEIWKLTFHYVNKPFAILIITEKRSA